MNKLFSKNLNSLLKFKYLNLTISNSSSYQTEYQLKKFKFKRSNDEINQQIENLTDKNKCLEQLKQTSESLIKDLKDLKWLKNVEDSQKQLKMLKNSFDLNVIISKHLKSNQIVTLTDYISKNFDQFNTKEKSIIFKIFSLINQSNLNELQNSKLLINQKKVNELLARLELDYYDHIDRCDLIDFCNYLDGFYLFRNSNNHFLTKSVDKIFRKALSEIESSMETESNKTLNQSQADSINKQWLENLKSDNKYVLGLYTLNKLSLLNGDGRGLYYFNLISNHYEKLSNESLEVLAYVLTHFHFNMSHMRLSINHKELFLQLFNNNLLKLIENIDKLKINKVKISIIDWFTKLNTTSDEVLNKYKTSLINYFVYNLKNVQTVPDFTTNIKCLYLLINSSNRSGKTSNLKNTFFRTYDPLFGKLMDKFVKLEPRKDEFESIINFRSNQKYNKRSIPNSIKQDIKNKFENLYENFNVFSINEIVESYRVGEFKWIVNELADRFVSNYSYNLNSMPKELRQFYLLEASKINREINGLPLNKKILDSILKEFVLNKDKSFQTSETNKELSAAISLILSNHEYSVYKFNMLIPIINNLIDNKDLNILIPILDSLINDFYFTTFPGKTNDLLNRVRDKLIDNLINFSDQNANNISLNDTISVINCLFKAKDKTKFDSNMGLNIKNLKENFENCLNEFDKLNHNTDNLKDLSEQLKLFENKIFKYSMCLKQVSNLILLSNDYNKELFFNLMSCVLRLFSIFHDNLFTKTIVEDKQRKNFFTRTIIFDLSTMFGLFNYYDLNHLLNYKKEEMTENLNMLKFYNQNIYDLVKKHDKMDPLQMIEYNFSLLNLNIECNEPINDLFDRIRSFDDIKSNFGHLNQTRIELISKLVYFINQTLCIKHKDSNLLWLFKDSKPLLPTDSAFRDVHSTLNSILDTSLVLTNPVYDFNFTANFEIAIDDNNNFVDPRSNTLKYRIPILIVNNSYYYNNLTEFKKPIATYIENFKKLYPVVTVNSSKLEEMKSMKDKLDYIRERMINGLEEYAEK